jgi:hypothetical protein
LHEKERKKEGRKKGRKAANRNKHQLKKCSRIPADRHAYDVKEENNFKILDADYQCMR